MKANLNSLNGLIAIVAIACVSSLSASQPEPSFTIVGEAHARRIWPRGPKYSATPSACRIVAASNARHRAATAAQPSAFQAPEQW